MILQICLVVGVVSSVSAVSVEISTKYSCGQAFTMDHEEEVDLMYYGADIGTSKCSTEFKLLDNTDYEICIQPKQLNIACGTTVQYQEHFVSDYINDGEFTCTSEMDQGGEKCLSYVSTFFIVIQKEYAYTTNEQIKFHVYAKSTGLIGSIVGIVIGATIVPIILVIVCVVCCKLRQRRRQEQACTRVNYQTTVGAAPVQSGMHPSQQPLLPNQPMVPGRAQPYPSQQTVDGYTVHPMVSAYPAGNQPMQGTTYSYPPPQQQYGVAPATYSNSPSAPPLSSENGPDAPPPSYESLMNK